MACTEEVYLGPPLCYSMVLAKKPRRLPLKDSVEYLSSLDPDCERNDHLQCLTQEGPRSHPGDPGYPSGQSALDRNHDHVYLRGSSPSLTELCYSSFSTSSPSNSSTASLQGPKPQHDEPSLPPSPPPRRLSSGAQEEAPGEEPYLLCDVAGGEVAAAVSVSAPQEERSRNEGPPYLNPRARVAPIDSSAAECSADTKTLQSNMGAVMTKISVCSSATNPSKEPAATATRINPKINCWPMREADREAGSRLGKQEEKGRRGWSGSQQEAAPEMQVSAAGVILRITQVLSAQLQVLVPPPSGPVAPERC